MKKIWLLNLCFIVLLFQPEMIHASEYQTYQDIHFSDTNNKLLRNFRDYDYNRYYQRIEGRKFWGWNTYTVTNDALVTFQKETLIIIENEGITTIDQSYYFKSTEQEKRQITASGSISTETSGNVKAFKLGLEQELNLSMQLENQSTLEERNELKIRVDPMTRLSVEVYGEGRISNGVGKHFRFFRNTRTGGWEVFTLTTEYYSVTKERMAGFES